MFVWNPLLSTLIIAFDLGGAVDASGSVVVMEIDTFFSASGELPKARGGTGLGCRKLGIFTISKSVRDETLYH